MSGSRETIPWEAVVRDPLALARHREIAAEHAARPLPAAAAALGESLARLRFDRARASELLVAALRSAAAPAESIEAAARLADPSCAVVITGQQPGYLAGPLYTLLKAAHTVALAREIERRSGRPTAALFWNHSDDHDLDETRGISLPDARGELRRLALDLGRGRPFLSDVAVPEDAAAVWEKTAELLPAGVDRETVARLFRPEPGKRFAAETTRILLTLLGGRGLVVFEPRDLQPLFAPALAAVVRDAREGLGRLAKACASIRERGLRPAFDENDPALVFVRTPAGRERARFDGARFRLPGGAEFDPAALADEVLRSPGSFSAGVACRLVVEALALPVVAAIRGPAELAYAPCAAAFLPASEERPLPVEVPRFSTTLVEPRLRELLGGLGVSAAAFVAGESPRSKSAAQAHPAETALAALESEIAERLRRLRGDLTSLDANLARPFEKTLASAVASIEMLRSKVRAASEERAGIGEARVRRVAAWLRPNGLPQERVLPAAPFLCAGLEARLAEILASVDPVPSAHVLLSLDGSP